MSVRMRHTRARSGNRRSHHAIEGLRLSRCSNCSESHLRHRMCDGCGHYRGKLVVDVLKKHERSARRSLAKDKARGVKT